MGATRGSVRRREAWFRVILVAAAALGSLLAVVAAELAARVVRPEWAPPTPERAAFWTYDPLLGWKHRAGRSGRFVHPPVPVEVTISSAGLRDAEYSPERNGRKRMLVLDDSVVWGFGVAADDRRGPHLRHPAEWRPLRLSPHQLCRRATPMEPEPGHRPRF